MYLESLSLQFEQELGIGLLQIQPASCLSTIYIIDMAKDGIQWRR